MHTRKIVTKYKARLAREWTTSAIGILAIATLMNPLDQDGDDDIIFLDFTFDDDTCTC